MPRRKKSKAPQATSFQRADLSRVQSAFHRFLRDRGESLPRGISSDHSLLDSADFALGRIEAELTGQTRWAPAPGRGIRGLETRSLDECFYWLFRYAMARVEGHQAAAERYANKYKDNQCDPGWLETVYNYVKYYYLDSLKDGGKPHYVECPPDGPGCVYPLPPAGGPGGLRVGVLGDWGTGQQVAEIVLDQLMRQKPDLIIHVGDIYYSGTWDEGQRNFLDLLNAARTKSYGSSGPRPAPVYNLPGNHDYYTGGTGFYRLLPMLNSTPYAPPGTPLQDASFWSLVSDGWQLQGMDTGYYDHDLFKVGEDMTHLHPSERDWHRQKIREGLDRGRKVILFSHHQFCSALEKIGGRPYNKRLDASFRDLLPEVTGWFWGHEHLLEIYGPYRGLAKGRCIGYSAFPVTYDPGKYKPFKSRHKLPELNPKSVLGKTGGVFDHGFAVLTLGASGGTADYYSVPGDGSARTSTKLFSESL